MCYIHVRRITRDVLISVMSFSPRSIHLVKEHPLITSCGSRYDDELLFIKLEELSVNH